MDKKIERKPNLDWLGWWGKFKHGDWIKLCKQAENVSQLLIHRKIYKNSYKNLSKIYRIALEFGADPNFKCQKSTITADAAKGEWPDQKRIVMTLLEYGGNADDALRAVAGTYCGEVALDTAKAILQFGGDPNGPDKKGITPLMVASGNGPARDERHLNNEGYLKMVQLLLSHGGDPNICDPEWGSSLAHAAFVGDDALEISKLLFKHGADANVTNAEDRSPLSLAAMAVAKETVKLLINERAEINHQDKYGATALMEAAEKATDDDDEYDLEEALEIIQTLLDHGAKNDLRDTDGRSACDRAAHRENHEAMALLKP